MSNSIWKTPDQEQERTKDVYTLAEYTGKRVYYDFDDFVFRHPDLKRWCYLDDLIAQADKAERLQKQFDRAKWWLKEIVENHRYTPISTAEMALKELSDDK